VIRTLKSWPPPGLGVLKNSPVRPVSSGAWVNELDTGSHAAYGSLHRPSSMKLMSSTKWADRM
jgi:hypothetical protein